MTDANPRAADLAAAADRLDHEWDQIVAARSGDGSLGAHPGGPPTDPLTVARRLHARDDAPAPDPGFARRLLDDLLAPERSPVPRAARDERFGLLPRFGWPSPRHLLAAAAILVVLLGGPLASRGLVPSWTASPTVAARGIATVDPVGMPAGTPCSGALPGVDGGGAASITDTDACRHHLD